MFYKVVQQPFGGRVVQQRQVRACAAGEGSDRFNRKLGRAVQLQSTLLPIAPYLVLGNFPALSNSLKPFAVQVNALNLPPFVIKYFHGLNMGIVLLAMGFYGSAYLGWQIRTSTDEEARAKAKNLHPLIAIFMTVFFSLGALGGLTSLVCQDKPVFESGHVTTAIIGLLMLYTQGMISLYIEDQPGGARTVHTFFGFGVLAVFSLHSVFGLQLALSL